MDLNQTGLFISALRKQNNMTQKELAEKIDVTDKAVSRWETGKGFPDVSLLQPLAKTLGVSISEIVMGETSEAEETVAVKTMDNAIVRTMSKFARSKRRATLCRRIVTLLVFCLLCFVFLVQIPLPRDVSVHPQIYLISQIHLDYVDLDAWNTGIVRTQSSKKGSRRELATNNLDDVRRCVGEEYDLTRGWSKLIIASSYNDKINHVARELTRDGETVTVVYFYPSQTLITRLIELLENDIIFNTISLADRLANDEHKMVEVYYLPENFHKINNLRDDRYDAERHNGLLVWSGLI